MDRARSREQIKLEVIARHVHAGPDASFSAGRPNRAANRPGDKGVVETELQAGTVRILKNPVGLSQLLVLNVLKCLLAHVCGAFPNAGTDIVSQ